VTRRLMDDGALEDLERRLSGEIRALPIGPARTSPHAEWLNLAWRVVRVARGIDRAQAGSSRPKAAQIAEQLTAGERVPIDDLRRVVLKPSEREFLARSRHATKKSAAQLDREIAQALATGPSVTISVQEDENEESAEETYTISDNGGEFDDASEQSAPDVQGDIDERRMHYRAMGLSVVLDVPKGRDWR
jgi:hypothetical protein